MLSTSLRLVRPIGGGGMGTLWIADHLRLKTSVAVKLLVDTRASDEAATLRFEREAAAAAQVKSPHVVQILDYGVSTTHGPYIVMELLDGCDLAAWLAKHGPLPARDVLTIVSQLAKALDRAHACGVIHRDVKPANVFVCEGDSLYIKLLDFGIAKVALESNAADMTKTGALIGTPSYMSPEQLVGAKDIDGTTDIWSLGVIAFQCLTGQRPFDGGTPAAIALSIHAGARPRISALDPTLPKALDAWFARACATDRGARFARAGDAADALAVALGEKPSSGDAAYSPMPALAHAASSTLTSASLVANGPPQRRASRRLAVGAILALATGATAWTGKVALERGSASAATSTESASATTGPPSVALSSPPVALSSPPVAENGPPQRIVTATATATAPSAPSSSLPRSAPAARPRTTAVAGAANPSPATPLAPAASAAPEPAGPARSTTTYQPPSARR
jgi:serine/threonine-protein kinase